RPASTTRAPAPARALRISPEYFFDLLGQRADLLQAMFATLFGARRAEWGLTTGEFIIRGAVGPAVRSEALGRRGARGRPCRRSRGSQPRSPFSRRRSRRTTCSSA